MYLNNKKKCSLNIKKELVLRNGLVSALYAILILYNNHKTAMVYDSEHLLFPVNLRSAGLFCCSGPSSADLGWTHSCICSQLVGQGG